MNDAYERLRKRVYEIIYDGKPPLNLGCEIEGYGIITKIVGMELWLNGTRSYVSKGQVKRGVCVNLGKPLSLPDLLRAMNKKSVSIHISETGQMFDVLKRECSTVGGDFFINLSLPMSEQTDEVLKKLNALLV